MDTRRTDTQRDYQERILRVLVHIQTHLDDALDLDSLARPADFSPFHFHRVFCGMVGEPVKTHVRRLRLERAVAVLKHGAKDDLLHVALAAGYDSHEAFTRSFGKRFGTPPSDCRRFHRSAAPSGVVYEPNGVADRFDPWTEQEGRTMEAKIETLDAIKVAFVRHVGPYASCGRPGAGSARGWAPRGCSAPRPRCSLRATTTPTSPRPTNSATTRAWSSVTTSRPSFEPASASDSPTPEPRFSYHARVERPRG